MKTLTQQHAVKFPDKMGRFDKVYIWSGQWRAWWRLGGGYTDDIRLAGIFSASEAFANTRHCGPEKKIVYQQCVTTNRRINKHGT